MKQIELGLNLNSKKTRKREFLSEMNRVVPWSALVELIAPYYPEGKTGRPPFSLESMLRLHFMQQWFGLSHPAMEEAFFDIPLYREFTQLQLNARLPNESTILLFCHRLEKHKLAAQMRVTVNDLLKQRGLLLRSGSAVDATLIAAPTWTKNKSNARDPEMHSTKKANQWYFGMKAHIGVDAESGLVHTVRGKAANVHDVNEGNALLQGNETEVYADAGYRGVTKGPDAKSGVNWNVAMGPGKRKLLDKENPREGLIDKLEKLKAGLRAKVEHPFRLIKHQFGYTKVRYRGLKKNTAQLVTLFKLSKYGWLEGK